MKKWVGLLLILSALAIGPAQALHVISGFDPRSMEIDGNVGYDATCQICTFAVPTPINCFTRTPCTDWLVRQSEGLVFLTDPTGNDDTSILSPDSILSDGSTLPKQDIYRIGLANDLEYFWLSEERRANNGTSAWHVFLTRIAPTAIVGQPVTFHFVPGDTEIRICFPRGGAVENAAITVLKMPGNPNQDPPPDPFHVIADDIWSSGVLSQAVPVAGFMMNTATIPALVGALDSHENPVTTYEPATFAEAAIRLSDMGITPCGTTLFVTVITRSSCTLNSDLKDIAGPDQYNFGGPDLVVEDAVTSCTLSAHFKATASGGTKPYTFNWYNNGSAVAFHTATIDAEPAVDEFDFSLPAGTHDVQVVVTDNSSCSDDADVPQFRNYNALGLTCNVTTPDCANKSTLSATPTGGSGSYKYEWFDNGSPIGSDTNSFDYTFPNPSSPTDHTIRVLVTDVGRADSLTCTIDCQKTVTVYPLLGLTCNVTTPDCENKSTLSATATGGSGSYKYEWTDNGTPIGGNTSSFDYTFPNPSIPTTHTIRVVVTDVGRASPVCVLDCQKTVTVYQILDGTLTAGTATCGVFTWTATPTGGKAPYTYVWKLDGVTVPGQTSSTYAYGPDADCTDHEVCVIITDDRSCTKTICKKVHQEITTTFP